MNRQQKIRSVTRAVAKVEQNRNDEIIHRGESFPGCNKPKNAPKGSKKKKRVLACKGDEKKIIEFGARGYSDYTKHEDPERRKNYHKRHGAIRLKNGKRAVDDKFQAAYWSAKKLW